MSFFENLAGFLFRPFDQCKRVLLEEKIPKKFTKTLLFVLYSAIILGIISCFWILYPERLYYGVPLEAELKNLFRITFSTPINLLTLMGIIIFLVAIFHFMIMGLVNYLIGSLLSKQKVAFKQSRNYLSIYGYSTLPLLLLGVFTIFWVYFVEKFNLTSEVSPFF